MKKHQAIQLMLLCIFATLLFGCGKKQSIADTTTHTTNSAVIPSPTPSVAQSPQNGWECVLLQELEGDSKIYATYPADYDRDGLEDVFVIIAPESASAIDGTLTGSIGFIEGETVSISPELTFIWSANTSGAEESVDIPTVFNIGDRSFFSVTCATGFSVYKNIYTIQNNQLISFEEFPYFENIGQNISALDGNDLTVSITALDASEMKVSSDGDETYSVGRTSKPYYFYWEEDSCCFREYGAIELYVQDFLDLNGATNLLTEIPSNSSIDEIYYRSNNVITINYHIGDIEEDETAEQYYIALYLQDNILTELMPDVPKEEKQGHYESAVYPDIADYPSEFLQ